jgi:hypothetical protein
MGREVAGRLGQRDEQLGHRRRRGRLGERRLERGREVDRPADAEPPALATSPTRLA